jgi:hypothetical protein
MLGLLMLLWEIYSRKCDQGKRPKERYPDNTRADYQEAAIINEVDPWCWNRIGYDFVW